MYLIIRRNYRNRINDQTPKFNKNHTRQKKNYMLTI